MQCTFYETCKYTRKNLVSLAIGVKYSVGFGLISSYFRYLIFFYILNKIPFNKLTLESFLKFLVLQLYINKIVTLHIYTDVV